MEKNYQLDDKKISEILVKQSYLAPEDLKKAEDAIKGKNIPLVAYLLEEGFVSKDLLGQAIAEFFGVVYMDLNSIRPSREQVMKIPEDIAKKFRVVFATENESGVVIATDNPMILTSKNLGVVMKKYLKAKSITVGYSLPDDIDGLLVYYRQALEARFIKIIKESEKVAPQIIDEIIQDALIYRASDVHFEPQAKEVLIRFRIDGMLQEVGRISKEYYENILNRIKVQAKLRLDEHASAQDGAIRFLRDEGQIIDMRVSIVPTLDGEKIVIRILFSYVRSLNLNDLGFSPEDQKIFMTAAKKPFGMIMIVGPTGSGKTTTLYALLKILNRPEVNITTIEDPVEYRIANINQIQVDARTNLTFAKGLRSIVRQDPNIILVGEVRDNETADIAVNAALTGHLLLSTFHSNDAATAIPRLLDMKVEPFLLASTLELIVAQRLVRRVCEECRYSYMEDNDSLLKKYPDLKKYLKGERTTLYKGKGCNACNHTGYQGRTAIFELIPISQEIEALIMKNPASKEVWELARKEGAHSMFEDGLDKVQNGVTSLEELLRVASPNS